MRAMAWIATAIVFGGCGAAISPPGRGDVGFSASKALDGKYELEASAVRVGSEDGATFGDLVYQASFRGPLADGAYVDIAYFGHDVPGDEYGWGLLSAAVRKRLGGREDRVSVVTGLSLAGGVGGRWPGYEEGDKRYPKAISAGLGLGVRLRAEELLPGLALFMEHRVQRSYSGSGREKHMPPMTHWWQGSVGARYDQAGFFGTLSVNTATWSNYQSDGAEAGMIGLSLGYAFGG